MMVEADIHLRLLPKSELDISKVFEPLTCCLRGIWVHPYTDTQAKLAQDFGLLAHLWSEHDAIMSWLRLISTSDCFPHPYKTYAMCFRYCLLSQGHMDAPLYCYTSKEGLRFWNLGHLWSEHDAIA
jgi:hypothetical protein